MRAENIYGIGEPSAESVPVTMALVDDGEWSAVSEDGVTGLQTDWWAGLQHMFTTASCWLNVRTEVFGVTHVHCSSTGSDQQECHTPVPVVWCWTGTHPVDCPEVLKYAVTCRWLLVFLQLLDLYLVDSFLSVVVGKQLVEFVYPPF